MIIDREVAAVIMALCIVGSVLGIAFVLRSSTLQPFIALALLNSHCVMGPYPRYVVLNTSIRLCIFIDNHLGEPIYWMVIYRIGTQSTLPTNTSPSSAPAIAVWHGILDNGKNITFRVSVPIKLPPSLVNASRIALIFELWIYEPGRGWVYSGRWTHLYVEVIHH